MVLDPPLFLAWPLGYTLGLKVVSTCYGDDEAYDQALQAYQDSYDDDPADLLLVIVNEKEWRNSGSVSVSELRPMEKEVSYYVSPEGDVTAIAVHDMRDYTKLSAILGMVLTVSICIVLAVGSLFLSKVTQDLVLTPIEHMISKVKDITTNPIEAAQQAEEDIVKAEE